jgi:hypothetical protein
MSKTITPVVSQKTIELGFNADARRAIKAFADAKKAKAEAEKVIAENEAIIRQLLGDAEFITIGGVNAVKLVQVLGKQEINRELLRTNFPEVAEAVFYTNPYDFIKAL